MLQEFKAFALRGNVMDLAVGVIIGAAFGKIVSSMTNDVILPVVGLLMGKVDFSNLFINLSGGDYATLQAAVDAGARVAMCSSHPPPTLHLAVNETGNRHQG